ncbi:MAG: STAS domain-containing protein [Xanthomonadales bacterium]|nr:STAS domain-containing protein [Xanthomonadales bacterium]
MPEEIDTLRLQGRLTAPEVTELERRHRKVFGSRSSPEVVSLEGVDGVDSSALALLLEWQSRANKNGRELRFEQPPDSLRVIARLTGVAPLLGWTESESGAHAGEEKS